MVLWRVGGCGGRVRAWCAHALKDPFGVLALVLPLVVAVRLLVRAVGVGQSVCAAPGARGARGALAGCGGAKVASETFPGVLKDPFGALSVLKGSFRASPSAAAGRRRPDLCARHGLAGPHPPGVRAPGEGRLPGNAWPEALLATTSDPG